MFLALHTYILEHGIGSGLRAYRSDGGVLLRDVAGDLNLRTTSRAVAIDR